MITRWCTGVLAEDLGLRLASDSKIVDEGQLGLKRTRGSLGFAPRPSMLGRPSPRLPRVSRHRDRPGCYRPPDQASVESSRAIGRPESDAGGPGGRDLVNDQLVDALQV